MEKLQMKKKVNKWIFFDKCFIVVATNYLANINCDRSEQKSKAEKMYKAEANQDMYSIHCIRSQ